MFIMKKPNKDLEKLLEQFKKEVSASKKKFESESKKLLAQIEKRRIAEIRNELKK